MNRKTLIGLIAGFAVASIVGIAGQYYSVREYKKTHSAQTPVPPSYTISEVSQFTSPGYVNLPGRRDYVVRPTR